MFEKLQKLEQEYEELINKLSEPNVISNQNEYRTAGKRKSEIEDAVFLYRELLKAEKQIHEAEDLMKGADAEMKALAQEEFELGRARKTELEEKLKLPFCRKIPTIKRLHYGNPRRRRREEAALLRLN